MPEFAVQPLALRELAGLLGRAAEDTQAARKHLDHAENIDGEGLINRISGGHQVVLQTLGAERDPVRPVTLQIRVDDSLAGFVAQCRTDAPPPGCETRTPTTIEGFPAVRNDHDICQLMVVVTNEKTLLVNDLPAPSCERMVTIATLSLATLRAGT